jgi:hypothetical protein
LVVVNPAPGPVGYQAIAFGLILSSCGPSSAYIQIVNLPFWYPSPTAAQVVIGYTETLVPVVNRTETNVQQVKRDVASLSRRMDHMNGGSK